MPFFNIRTSLEEIVFEINENLYRYSCTDLFEASDAEREHQNRKSVLLALNAGVRVRNDGIKLPYLDADKLRKKAKSILARSKRNFVKRMVAKHGFFAMDEILKRYPGYDEYQLERDLAQKPKKKARKERHYPVYKDARRVQMRKLAWLISKRRNVDPDDKEYHNACIMIAILQHAHNRKEPIRLAVKYPDEALEYNFAYNTEYDKIKRFIKHANEKGMSHERLKEIHNKL
jgi:hypothetical protein